MTARHLTWWWIFWTVLICARNPAGAKHWTIAKLIQDGWIKAEQTCPRRNEGLGFDHVNADWWDRDRWGRRWYRRLKWMLHNGKCHKLVSRIRDWGWAVARRRDFDRLGRTARWIGERFNWYQGGDSWEWPWQPRTCSFCGGVHPDDAVRLINEGWHLEGTTKSYKRYMEPPIIDGKRWSTVPPVKLYVQHFDKGAIESFNAALHASYTPMTGAERAA